MKQKYSGISRLPVWSGTVAALKTVVIVDVTTASKLDGMVVTTEMLLVCNVLGKIILESIDYKYDPLVGKEELEVEVPIT
jgi:hypothetical protein